MFEFRQLRSFVTVAEELHFSRAARRLNMTQPPLSRQIRLLEQAVGITLLERSSHAVHLTAAGRTFLTEARHILHMAENATLAAREAAGGQKDKLTVGFVPSSGYHFLPCLIEHCRGALPHLDLIIEEMTSPEQIQALTARRVDVAFLRFKPPERAQVKSAIVMREGAMGAFPAGDPRTRRATVQWLDFDQKPFITFPRNKEHRGYSRLTALFSQAGVSPIYAQHVSHAHSMLGLVQMGMGAAIVPESAQYLRFDGVVMRRLQALPAWPIELHMAWYENEDHPVLGPFLEAAKAIGAAQSSAVAGPELDLIKPMQKKRRASA